MTQIHIELIGTLTLDKDCDWYVSHPVSLPVLDGRKVAFVVEGYAEDDSPEDNMLSLGDLEAEADKIPNDTNIENKDNDWGDWLEEGDEDNLDLDTDILTLDAFDLDESEEWENDETEFLPNSEITSVKKDDKSED